jgi:hypothetical protein
MSNCEKYRDKFIEALYDELAPEEKRQFETHLQSCAECTSEFEQMATTLKIMDKRIRKEPGEGFWDGYWEKLSRRLEEKEHRARAKSFWKSLSRNLSFTPKWAYQAAVAVVFVAMGIFIGKLAFTPSPAPIQQAQLISPNSTAKDDENILRAQNYFERSKVVLMALVNFDPKTDDPYALNLPLQRKVSRDLVEEASFLKSNLSRPSQRRLQELISDLEVILIQIANLDSGQDLQAINFVKQGIESRGVLLKINVSEMWQDSQKSLNPKKSTI